MLKGVGVVLLSLFSSCVIFFIVSEFISPDVEKNNKAKAMIINENIDTSIEINECVLKCIRIYPNSDKKHNKCVKICYGDGGESERRSVLNKFNVYTYFVSKKPPPDAVILCIYFLIWIALFIQVLLSFITIFNINFGFLEKYNFDEIDIVDAALNSPPILGVMGTIYSFSSYTMKSENSGDLIEGFKDSFFDASFTTIMAGFIYIMNLYLKIIILRKG